MKSVFIFVAVLAYASADCDKSKYKKIGCFEISQEQPQFQEVFNHDGEAFDIDNYKEKLPQLVCDCFAQTKDHYKFFSVGHNGRCLGNDGFDKATPQSGDCVKSGHHEGGLENAEYVYQVKADAATPVDGGVSEYGPWGECSASCNGGKRSRERACIDPIPNDPGKECEKLTDIEACNEHPCPIDGGFSEWTGYGECSTTCGDGEKERTRECNNPTPEFGGKLCEGKTSEKTECNITPCPINGVWGAWEQWQGCVANKDGCGKGKNERKRSCDNPKPQHGGKACTGSRTQKKDCVAQNCIGDNKRSLKCEGKDVSLSCPSNWKIKIDYANYGRTNSHECDEWYNIHWSTNCKTGKDKIKNKCQDKQSCDFNCDNVMFGDPCRLTSKFCEVKYHCEGYDL